MKSIPIAVATFFLTLGFCTAAPELCRIDIVDEENGWPVPLVELRTIHQVRFVSDNAGVIAFDLPELMDRETWFSVEGHGYTVAADGFGFRGVRLTPTRGGRLEVKVQRTMPAQRLGRITGAGIFGESQQLGLEKDWTEQGILGCDSVQNAVHQGKLFWAWGDTKLAKYPLGIFHMTGATTSLRPLNTFEPPLKLRPDYFTDEQEKPRAIAKMPGDGPTWLGGFASLPDNEGKQRLVASYIKVKEFLTAYESGLCIWNDETQAFEKHKELWQRSEKGEVAPPRPDGHPVKWTDETGKEWLLFGETFPQLKCEPTFEAWENPEKWELLKSQSVVPSKKGGEKIEVHRTSIAWNEYHQKWITIFLQKNGTPSRLGEIWYAEADSPFGPWENAIKVVTHANYTFYNPKIHPRFTEADSPILIFEGTYTRTFSKNGEATPRYDYNQVMYRLDLDRMDFSGRPPP